MSKAAAPARSVRTESPIARTRASGGISPPRNAAAWLSAASIDRRVRLTAIQRLPAKRDIRVSQGAGAIDQRIAALDHDVGIGADHEQRTPAHQRQHLAVVLRRLDGVVEQAGADHVIRGLDRREGDVEAGEDRAVARRAEMEYALGAPRFDDTAGHVAGTGDCVIAVAADTERDRETSEPRRPDMAHW